MIAAKKLLKSQGKVKEEAEEEAAMEAISGPEDEDEIVETSAVESSPEKQPPPPPPPPRPTPLVGQRNSKWDETPQTTTAKFILVDGKFVPANNLATQPPPQTTLTTTPPIIGTPQDVIKTVAVSIEPPRLVIPTVTQQAQNVLSSMAASTSAFTAQQIRVNQLLTSISNATPQTSSKSKGGMTIGVGAI
jgi:hypothetical protein